MAYSIEIIVEGDKELAEGMEQFAKDIDDWRPEMRTIAEHLREFYSNAVFETTGSIIDNPWPRLSSAYELYKSRRFGGRGILERTGTLRKSFKDTYGKTEAKVVNVTPYALFHQLGTSRMSERPIMDVNNRVMEEVVKILARGLEKRLKENFAQ